MARNKLDNISPSKVAAGRDTFTYKRRPSVMERLTDNFSVAVIDRGQGVRRLIAEMDNLSIKERRNRCGSDVIAANACTRESSVCGYNGGGEGLHLEALPFGHSQPETSRLRRPDPRQIHWLH